MPRPVTEPPGAIWDHSKGSLARKLTCSVVSIVFIGVLVILFLPLGLIINVAPGWERNTKNKMAELEEDNIRRIASDKAEYVTEVFRRLQEGILQLQAFAEQVLLDKPSKMVVENYLKTYTGLDQDEATWEHSVWFITTLGKGEYPPAKGSLGGLINRSSLMDVPFRGMQFQNELIYLAALEHPSATVSDINIQSYRGRDTTYYLNFSAEHDCDDRYEDDRDSYLDAFDPHCREWYQDAIAGANTDIIFTNPYVGACLGQLTVTVATAVYGNTASTPMGVVGIDVDFRDIKDSLNSLTVIGSDHDIEENGYAYLLAPGLKGKVAVHRDLDSYGDEQFITDLEKGIDNDEFDYILSQISTECNGSVSYSKNGERWILAWEHETISVSAKIGDDDCDGFTVVVTVSEFALVQEFSHVGAQVRKIVTVATITMGGVLIVMYLFTIALTFVVSSGIVKPVNQLIDVVHALYTMDFSKHQVDSSIVDEVSSPEGKEFIEAFMAMSTAVRAANKSLRSGNLRLARENYVSALVLSMKLEDNRRVAITNNNLGTVHTLQAQELELNAVAIESRDPVEANRLNSEARSLYSRAISNYKRAIDGAAILCADIEKNDDSPSVLLNSREGTRAAWAEVKEPEAIDATSEHAFGDAAALFLQLSNRKFNLAMCIASMGYAVVSGGGVRDPEAINRARRLLHECIEHANNSKDEKGDVCKVRYLLEITKLETRMQRQIQAREALDDAEKILSLHRGNTPSIEPKEGSPRFLLVVGLPQRLLAARGFYSMASGDPVAAIACWTRAIIGSGDKMDVVAVESSLNGLYDLASGSGSDGIQLPSELLVALGLPADGVNDGKYLMSAIDKALKEVGKQTRAYAKKTSVDLCFIMDCTGSMQRWIDHVKTKLVDIIQQTKKDVGNVKLRVGFVGYRDYNDNPQYEGPYNFHSEQELPELIAKLRGIRAFGGTDFAEDMAGGLNLAANKLSWESDVRLCILIADAPCHGNMYHSGVGDRFPDGDKKGLDPTKLLYDLKYEHGVDLYFIKISDVTDRMIRIFDNRLAERGRHTTTRPTTDHEIKVLDLGSDHNRFLEAVVESVKNSLHRSPLLLEE